MAPGRLVVSSCPGSGGEGDESLQDAGADPAPPSCQRASLPGRPAHSAASSTPTPASRTLEQEPTFARLSPDSSEPTTPPTR